MHTHAYRPAMHNTVINDNSSMVQGTAVVALLMVSLIEMQHVWLLVSHEHRLLPLTSQYVHLWGNSGMALCM